MTKFIITVLFFFPGPQPNGEAEEDIDIVGSSDQKTSADRSVAPPLEESSNMRFYGPAQFTEADVLAFMGSEGGSVKKEPVGGDEPASPARSSGHGCQENESTEVKVEGGKVSDDEDDIDVLKEKLKKLEDSNKCSKCMVRFLTNLIYQT